MKSIVNRLVVLSSLAALASACTMESGNLEDLSAEDLESVGELGQEIKDGQDVGNGSIYARTTVAVNGCTGTIIGPRHVLTAAHCGNADVGSNVLFYTNAEPNGVSATVSRIYAREGVNADDTHDVAGKFADFLVLYLDRVIPSSSRIAKLAPGWPGNNVTMAQVGRGKHDGYDNGPRTMRYRNTRSYSSSNQDGHVLVEATTDSGDSGGPIFTVEGGRATVHGANWGNVFEWAMHGKYTSTSFHFYRIAEALGNVTKSNWDYIGNDLATIDFSSQRECVSECLGNASCKAYTFVPIVPLATIGKCFIKSGVGGGGRAAVGMVSGQRLTTGACDSSGGYCRL